MPLVPFKHGTREKLTAKEIAAQQKTEQDRENAAIQAQRDRAKAVDSNGKTPK